MYPFLFFILYIVLFYAIIRLVTKDRELSIWTVILWLIAVVAGRWLATFLAAALGIPEIPSRFTGVATAVGILIFILWHQGYSTKQIVMISVPIGLISIANLLAYIL